MQDELIIQSTESPLNKTFADKYLFIFELPEALKNLKINEKLSDKNKLGINKKSIQWSIVKAEVPNINIKAANINYAGGNLYYSTHNKSPYDPFKLTFKIDSQYLNYFTIYEWINFIYGETEGRFNEDNIETSDTFKAYTTPVSIVGLDAYNKPIIQWIFTYAFPTDLSSISLDYTSTDEIEFTATFVFSQMRIRNVAYEELKNNTLS
jgi:hypothetical protein